jgi:hypothetical protein
MFVQVLVVHVDGARRRLWNSATNGPTVHPPDDIWAWNMRHWVGFFYESFSPALSVSFHRCPVFIHVSWRLDNGPVGGPVPQRLSHPIATIKNKIGILTVQMCLSRCITLYHCCTVIEGHSCTTMTLENSWNNVANRAAEVLGTQTWWSRQKRCGRRAKPWTRNRWRQGSRAIPVLVRPGWCNLKCYKPRVLKPAKENSRGGGQS